MDFEFANTCVTDVAAPNTRRTMSAYSSSKTTSVTHVFAN